MILSCTHQSNKFPLALGFPEINKAIKKLKDKIRGLLNEIITENDSFSDGQDSTSVISVPLHFPDSPEIKFSFDLNRRPEVFH